jgi:hypothetical protein
MKRVLHIVAKDLRRLRGWVIGWLLALMIHVGIGVLLLQEEPTRNQWNGYGNLLAGALALQAAIAYLMTILLVQSDRVVGTDAFWMTRPVSGGRLMAAKLVAAGLVFVGGALLVYVPWWLFAGLGPREIAMAGVELLPPAAAVVLPAMLIGALTDSPGRALLWSLILAAVGVMTPMLYTVILNTASARAASDLVLYLMIGCGATLLAMAAAVAILYRTRRYTRWLAAPAVGLVVALLAGRFVPLVWRPANEPSEWRPERAAQVKVVYHDAYSRPSAPPRNNVERWDNVWVRFTLQGTSPDMILEGIGARQRWSWVGGAHAGREGRLGVLGYSGDVLLPGLQWLSPDLETIEWRLQQSRSRRLAPRGTEMSRPAEGPWLQANVPLPASIADRLDREPARYTGNLWLMWRRPTVRNEVPLRSDAWRRGVAQAMRLRSVDERDDTVVIRIVDTRAGSWLAAYREWRHRGRWFGTRRDQEFALVNRVRGELVPLQDSTRAHVVGGVRLTWRELTTRVLRVRRAGSWEGRPGWLDDATLAFVEAVPVSVFRRDVSVDAMRVRREEP